MADSTSSIPTQVLQRTDAATDHGSRFLIVLTLVVILIPANFTVGSWLLTPSRLLFLVILPVQFIFLLSGRYGKVTHIDILVILYMAWRTFVPFINNPQVALQYAGSNSVIFLGGYVVARASVRSIEDFRFMVKVLGGLVIFSFPFALYEATTGKFIIPTLIEKIPGVSSVADVNYRRRMGFDRAQFVFVHPIHYGIFCSLALSLYFYTLRGVVLGFKRWLYTGIILFSCFLSVSSGPFLSSIVQVCFVLWGHFFRKNERRWLILGVLSVAFYVVIELGSNRPGIVALMSLLTFSSSTANVRFILLEYGMAQIMRTPIFGVGLGKWDLPSWMTGSLDNFWLAIALVFGVPAFIFLFSAVVAGLVSIGRRNFTREGPLFNARMGWEIMMVSMTLTLATVFIWGEIASLVMFLIGSGVFLLTANETTPGSPDTEPVRTTERKLVYSRFGQDRVRPDNGAAKALKAAGK